ncbi:MAG: hypothetical protein E6902_05610 [Paeniclostridium sordellii]|nr:hypothetical protein [Paeniclostridium sordellii]
MIVLNTTTNYSVYVFSKNNCLFIKDSLGNTKKVSNSIYLYSSIIDNSYVIHICFIDLKGCLNYCTYDKNNINFISTVQLNSYVKKINKLSMYIVNNSLNIFFARYISHNLYNIHHINYDLHTYKFLEFQFKDVRKVNNSIYTINISNNYIVCSYINLIKSNNLKSMAFDFKNKYWVNFSNIKSSNVLFDYCNSIRYE